MKTGAHGEKVPCVREWREMRLAPEFARKAQELGAGRRGRGPTDGFILGFRLVDARTVTPSVSVVEAARGSGPCEAA